MDSLNQFYSYMLEVAGMIFIHHFICFITFIEFKKVLVKELKFEVILGDYNNSEFHNKLASLIIDGKNKTIS